MIDRHHDRIGVLLEAARTGDRDSLDQLVRELTPLLWHVARAQGLDRESSSDVVQHTWMVLLKSIANVRSPAALTRWLVQVTKREAWRAAKRAHVETPVDGDRLFDQPERSPGPEEQLVTTDVHRELWDHLRRLPERCRQLLRVVAFVPRPNYAELSSVLGIPRGSIGPTRGRCLARLRALLEGGADDGRR